MDNLAKYWEAIPVGAANAVTYADLEYLWQMTERQVRKVLEHLSELDNGDNYILIRSSRGKGFYLTDNAQDIASYKRECYSRAVKNFSPLKKIRRVQRDTTPEEINYSFFNNIRIMRRQRGYTQTSLCMHMRFYDENFDVSMLSRLENGHVMPTPLQLFGMSQILKCEPFELVTMETDSLNIYSH